MQVADVVVMAIDPAWYPGPARVSEDPVRIADPYPSRDIDRPGDRSHTRSATPEETVN